MNKWIDEFLNFKTMFKDISVCVAYNSSLPVYNRELDSYQKNNADYNMQHLPMHGIDVFAADEITDNYLYKALEKAKQNNKKYLLYMQVGNLINWNKNLYTAIYKQLYSDDYKFLGHILQHDNGSYYIHPQFFIIEIDWGLKNNVTSIDFADDKVWTGYVLERSSENFHDNYTPISVKATSTLTEYCGRGVGWSIIDKLAATNVKFSPWNNDVRNNKYYIYNYVSEHESLKHKQFCLDFGNENRTYLANTEITDLELINFIKTKKIKKIFMPASGANTFLYPYLSGVDSFIIYDKNVLSLEIYKNLLKNWNGVGYKDFIKKNYNIDNKDLFASPHLLDSEDEKIQSYGQDFIEWWNKVKNNKAVVLIDIFNHTYYNRINKVLDNKPTLFHLSNILHYHPTSMFYSTTEKYQLLQMFKNSLEKIISPQNLFFFGSDPLINSKICGSFDISNYDFSIVNKYPWRKK